MNEILNNYPQNQVFVLTDEHVEPLLAGLGLENYTRLVIPAGEAQKTLETITQIWDFLIAHQATRHALLINVGGGVITDMGGFAAATYKRGIHYVNIPTTLLAMVDAAAGGKTGFDYHGLKNEIGCFYSPDKTVIRPALLATLPIQALLSGLAEMIKHALIADEQELRRLMALDAETDFTSEDFGERLMHSIAIKERITAKDPHETGIRKALNFGHTIGHALEELSLEKDEKPMQHGYAVMYGMLAELYLSHIRLGLDKAVITMLCHFVIENYGRISMSCREYDRLLELMRHDKKNTSAGEINFTLLSEVGKAEVNQTANPDEIREALDFLFSA